MTYGTIHRNAYPDVADSNPSSETTGQEQFVETEIGTPSTGTNNQQPTTENLGPDGHPDGFTVRGRNSPQLSIKNIGGILLGIRNDTGREMSGDIWVNEIHLGDPLVRAGWARRGNMSMSLGNIVKLRGGLRQPR